MERWYECRECYWTHEYCAMVQQCGGCGRYSTLRIHNYSDLVGPRLNPVPDVRACEYVTSYEGDYVLTVIPTQPLSGPAVYEYQRAADEMDKYFKGSFR